MSCTITFTDRSDQLEWLVDDTWTEFRINVQDRKHDIYKWLEDSGRGKVIIHGAGELPKPGLSNYAIWMTYYEIQRNNYRIYFQDSDTAMLFKLAWGGAM